MAERAHRQVQSKIIAHARGKRQAAQVKTTLKNVWEVQMEHSKIDQTGKTSNTECTDIAIQV